MLETSFPAEAELTLFRFPPVQHNRRHDGRYRCALATIGKLTLDSGESFHVLVHNLSATGVGLNVPRPLANGLRVTIRLRPKIGPLREFTVRVAHCTAEVDRSWRVGCQFETPLGADLLDSLLD